MAANLDILINATNNASTPLRQINRDLDALDSKAGAVSRSFSGLQSAVGFGLKAAAGIGIAGVTALGAGFGAAVTGGVQLNSTLENVEAQLFAFTKDGDVAKQIIEDIRVEAAQTPFAFEEMAKATASLLPAAKQSGAELMDLVKTAQILAASNPEQGLEGAAFSIREALSGDFVSIVDRFNLPRQRLNELKEEGVPAMEAISIAMREMGLDADLVTGLAGTMTGRWSTFTDTIDTLKGTLAAPLFDFLKEGLTELQGVLDANMPTLQALATTIGERLADAFETARVFITSFIDVLGNSDSVLVALKWALIDAFGEDTPWVETIFNVSNAIQEFLNQISGVTQPIIDLITQFVSWQDVLGAVGIVVAAMVIPALASFVAAAAPVIAIGAALVAGVSLLRNAWESNFGGIQEITQSVMSVVGDFIEERFGRLVAWWGDNLPRLQQITQTVVSAIQGLWSGEGGAVVQLVITLFRTMLDYVRVAMDTILDVVQVVLQLLTGDFEGAGDTITRIWSRLTEFLLSTVRTLAPLLIAAFVEIATAITGAFSSIDWGGVGSAIIGGIRAGVVGAAGSLASAAIEAAQGALNGVRNILGIRSPSKVFEGVGENMMQGMANGISRRAEAPATAAATAAGATYNFTIAQTFGSNMEPSQVRQATRAGIGDTILEAQRRRGI
jgi:hypothetical protein